MVDLRRLGVLRAVAHYGTVTAAAQALHLTPSAASQQVRTLARELDVLLLEPDGRRVRLTAAARDLLVHADAIEERWQLAQSELRRHDERLAGTIRLCGVPTAVSTLLAPTVVALAHDHPTLSVALLECEPDVAFDRVFSGESDLAVIDATPASPPLNDRRFEQRSLLVDPFELLVPAGHPLAHSDEVSLIDAAAEQWILGLPETSYRQHALSACNAAGFTPRIAHETREWSVSATLVAHGLGVALVPRLARLPGGLDVVRRRLDGTPLPVCRFMTCTRRGGRSDHRLQAVLTRLAAVAETLTSDAGGIEEDRAS